MCSQDDHDKPASNDGQTISAPVKNVHDKPAISGSTSDAPTSSVNGPDHDSPSVPLSKNQQKKLKRKLEWEDGREARKVKRRAKAKEKRQSKHEEYKELIAKGIQPPSKPPRQSQVPVPLTIILDCDFEELMSDGELISLASQLTRSYSDVRKSNYRPHLAFSSFKGALKNRFDGVLGRTQENWAGVTFSERPFDEVANEVKAKMATENIRATGPLACHVQDAADSSKVIHSPADSPPLQPQGDRSQSTPGGQVIYLSSDSDTTLTHLEPHGVYIIGGLVDKNRHKGVCHQRAMAKGIKTAKLPIGDYLKMRSRQVLTTNQVNEIVVKWLELGDWGKAFMHVIPKRKGGVFNEQDVNADLETTEAAVDSRETIASGDREASAGD